MIQKSGNHGRIIPRDKDLLTRLYWGENKTTIEIAALFDVNHKSIHKVMVDLGISRRGVGHSRNHQCIECGKPVVKINHPNNGSPYGKRCEAHQRNHKRLLAIQARKRPEVKERISKLNARSYYQGPLKPNGELQWVYKSRAMLRAVKRALANGTTTPEALRYLKLASIPEKTLPK